MCRKEARSRVTPLTDLWVDIGVRTAREAEKLVAVGDPMVIDRRGGTAQRAAGRTGI